jgi:hypothetical protein
VEESWTSWWMKTWSRNGWDMEANDGIVYAYLGHSSSDTSMRQENRILFIVSIHLKLDTSGWT